MNDGERHIGCRYALLIDRHVDEQRLLGGGTSVVDDELMDDERSSVPAIKIPEEHHVRIVTSLAYRQVFRSFYWVF